MGGQRVQRGGVAYTAKAAAARHKRPCRSAPATPQNVAVTFRKVRRRGKRDFWNAIIAFDQVTLDVAGRPLSVERYDAQLRYTDASGVPISIDGSTDDVRHGSIAGDDTPRRIPIRDLERPRAWYVQARVRVLNRIHGGRCWSAWSGWTTPAVQPVSGALAGPSAPTGLTLTLDKVEGTARFPWRARVGWNELTTWQPADDDGVVEVVDYHVQLAVSNDAGSTTANTRNMHVPADQSLTTNKADFFNCRGKRSYRARVRAKDAEGQWGAYTSWTTWLSPGGAPGPVTNLTWSNPTPATFLAKWDKPTDPTDAVEYYVKVLRMPGSVVVDEGFTYGNRWRYHIPKADRGNNHKARVKTREDEISLDVDGAAPAGYAAPDASTDTDSTELATTDQWDVGSEVNQVIEDDDEIVAELVGGPSAFGDLYVGDLISPSTIGRLSNDLDLWVDPVNGSDDNDGRGPKDFLDSFTRSLTDKWSDVATLSDSGHAWQVAVEGTAADFDVDGTRGTVVLGASDGNSAKTLWGGAKDCEVFTTFQYDKLPSGAITALRVSLRFTDADNYLYAHLTVPTAGNMTLSLWKRVGGTNTELVADVDTGIARAASTDFSVRAQAYELGDGNMTLRARVWSTSGAEPGTWNVETSVVSVLGYGQTGPRVGTAAISNAPITWKFNAWEAKAISFNDEVVAYVTGLPLASIQRAVDLVPKYISADVNINCVPGGVFDESIEVSGVVGAGIFTLDGFDKARTVINGKVLVEGCAAQVVFQNFEVQDDGSTSKPTVNVHAARFVTVTSVNAQANSNATSVIRVENGSQAKVTLCDARGASDTSTSSSLSAEGSSIVQWSNNTGTGPASGFGIRNNGAIAFLTGTNPSGGNSSVNAGQTFGTYTSTAGAGASTSTRRTKYYSAKRTQSWRDTFGWRTDTDDVYQGSYGFGNHKGLWFYYHGTIASDLAGKTLQSIFIRVSRRATGGQSGAQQIRAYLHDYSTPPGGEPTITSATVIGSLKWGETKWLKLPLSFATALKAGTAKGVAIHQSTGSPYAICNGKSRDGATGRLKITYTT